MVIRITLCRAGKVGIGRPKAKGIFVKNFESIEHFVKFLHTNRGWFFIPYYEKELTKSQRKQVAQKLEAMFRKSLI